MIRIKNAALSYLTNYHVEELDRNQKTTYLDAEQSRPPMYGGRSAAYFGMTGDYTRQTFMLAADGKYRIHAGASVTRDDGGYVDVKYHGSGKKLDKDGVTKDVDAAIEVVLSPPKSWSIATHLAKDGRKSELQTILEQASVAAMNRMEDLIRVRITTDGFQTQEKASGIHWTMFSHSSTRRGDPDEHKHVIVNKHVLCQDGVIRTIDEASWLRIHLEMDAVYKTELARQAAALGYELDMTENGPELRCISHDLRKAFSSAREEMKTFLEGFGIDIAKASESERTWANMSKRLGKVSFDKEHVERMYRAKTAAAGIDYDAIQVRPELAVGYELVAPKSAREAVEMALAEIHERFDAIKHRHDLAYKAAKYQGFAGSVHEINRTIDNMLAEKQLIFREPLKPGERVTASSLKLTSSFAIARERAAVKLYGNSIGRGVRVTSIDQAERAIAEVEAKIAGGIKKTTGKDQSISLTAGQREMVMAALGITNSDRITVVRGDPGTGKTTGMEATRIAAESAGWTVLGLAPSDAARDALQEAGINSNTVQLASQSDSFWGSVNSRTVLVVDESGMIDSRQMNILLDRAQAKGARVCLVGDYEQIVSVEAGTPFHRICNQARKSQALVEMTEMSRGRTDDMRKLHVLSRDDQALAIQKILNGGSAGRAWFGTPEMQDLHKLPRSAQLAGIKSIVEQGQACKFWNRVPQLHPIAELSGADRDVAIQKLLDSGAPAASMWAASNSQLRYEYVASQWIGLKLEERLRVPIVVDTNADRMGVTNEIRAQLGTETVFTVDSFESLQFERVKHQVASSYEPGMAIKMNSRSGRLKKGEVLTVESVREDVVRAIDQDGARIDFNPAVDGPKATLGEFEKTDIGIGELVRFSAKLPSHGILNGDRGIVKSITKDGKSVIEMVGYDGKVKSTKEIDLSKRGVSVRHGIATTVHGLQGASIDQGIYLSSSTTRNQFLVALTRFKYHCTLVADTTTQERMQALVTKAKTRQHKESALPTKSELANLKFRRPVVNAAWHVDDSGRATTRFTAFPAATEISGTSINAWLQSILREQTSIHITGSKSFLEGVDRVAAAHGYQGVSTTLAEQQAMISSSRGVSR